MSSNTEFTPRYLLPDGTVVDPGTLWQVKGGGWMAGRPMECPNGHPLGAGRVWVSTQACQAVPIGCHLIHTCRECKRDIVTPPPGPRCHHTSLDGRPAR